MELDFDGFKIDVSKYYKLNMYLKTLDEIKKLINKEYDFLQVVDGRLKTGVGKSTLALFSARYVDQNFGIEKIAFADIKQILRLVRRASAGDSIVIDEGGILLFSRSWRSREAIIFNKTLMMARAKRVFLQVVIPSVFYLDKYVRQSLHALVSVKKRGYADYYAGKELRGAWAPHIYTMNPKHQTMTKTPKVAFTFQFPKIDGWKVYKEYLEMKMNFIKEQTEKWETEVEEEKGEATYEEITDEYMTIEEIMNRLRQHGYTLSETQLRRRIIEAGLESKKVGRRTVYRRNSFPALLAVVEKKHRRSA